MNIPSANAPLPRIVILGAGRSASAAIAHLYAKGQGEAQLEVYDLSAAAIEGLKAAMPRIRAQVLSLSDAEATRGVISGAHTVISLLPADMHVAIAEQCIALGANLITPSYASAAMLALHQRAAEAGATIVNELGLDPGIDHMSTMEIVERLKAEGAEIESYKSWCGGLVSPQSDTNPWHYKISWNPQNVVRAGADGALYRLDGNTTLVPYHRLFAETEAVRAQGMEPLEGYYNRNSVPYISRYGLEGASTFLRGTLRYPGYCDGWHQLVNAGLTNSGIEVHSPAERWGDFARRALRGQSACSAAIEFLLDVGGDEPLDGSLAEVLQRVVERAWRMQPSDRDRVVMIHDLEYSLAGQRFRLRSTLDLEGENARDTAMARTVGLPLALCALLLVGGLRLPGMVLPTHPSLYRPLLASLRTAGIGFTEVVEEL